MILYPIGFVCLVWALGYIAYAVILITHDPRNWAWYLLMAMAWPAIFVTSRG